MTLLAVSKCIFIVQLIVLAFVNGGVILCRDLIISCCGNNVVWLIFRQERPKCIGTVIRLPWSLERRLSYIAKIALGDRSLIQSKLREMLNWNKKLVLWLCCSQMSPFLASQVLQRSNSNVLFGRIWSFSVFAVSGMASGVMAEHKLYSENPCIEKITWEERICEIPKCIMTKLKANLWGFVLEYVLKSIWNPFYSFLLWAFWANSLRKNAKYCICQAVFISCICYES